MQLIKAQATARSSRWILSGGVAVLALGASPAHAGTSGDLFLRTVSSALGAHAAGGQLGTTDQSPGDTDLMSSGQRVRPPDVLVPDGARPGGAGTQQTGRRGTAPLMRVDGIRAGGTDVEPYGSIDPPVLRTDEATPGGTDSQATGTRGSAPVIRVDGARAGATDVEPYGSIDPPVMRTDEATPGGTDSQAAGTRGSAVMRVDGARAGDTDGMSESPPAVKTPDETTPGGTGADATGDHRPAPMLRVEGIRAGATGALPTDTLAPDVLNPEQATPGDPALAPSAKRERPDASLDAQRWTALATFTHAGLDFVAFNVANRLSLATTAAFPAPLASLDLAGFVSDIDVVMLGGTRYVLVAMGGDGIAIVDAGDPALPELTAVVQVSYPPEGVSFAGAALDAVPGATGTVRWLATDGTTLWIGDGDYGLQSTALEHLLPRAGSAAFE